LFAGLKSVPALQASNEYLLAADTSGGSADQNAADKGAGNCLTRTKPLFLGMYLVRSALRASYSVVAHGSFVCWLMILRVLGGGRVRAVFDCHESSIARCRRQCVGTHRRSVFLCAVSGEMVFAAVVPLVTLIVYMMEVIVFCFSVDN
jgi:hypothetical protein